MYNTHKVICSQFLMIFGTEKFSIKNYGDVKLSVQKRKSI